MTSTTDEICNLRAGLNDILTWCHNTATATSSDVERATCNHVAAMVRRALKTPRTSVPVRSPKPVPKVDPGQPDEFRSQCGHGNDCCDR